MFNSRLSRSSNNCLLVITSLCHRRNVSMKVREVKSLFSDKRFYSLVHHYKLNIQYRCIDPEYEKILNHIRYWPASQSLLDHIHTVAHRGHGNMQSSTATYKVPRQHTKFHGNIQSSTATYKVLRQHTKFYGNIRSFTATYKVTRQNEKFSRGNIQNSIKCTDLYIEVSG